MRISVAYSRQTRQGRAGHPRGQRFAGEQAFTLIEIMVVMGLLTILLLSSAAGILMMDRSSRRLSDYTAAMAVVEAKVQDVRAATYNPPNYPFTAGTVFLTNNNSVALDQAGATFLVPGTLLTRIEPSSGGHLVTVTGTFQSRPGQPFDVTLQTVVNKYSGGQQ